MTPNSQFDIFVSILLLSQIVKWMEVKSKKYEIDVATCLTNFSGRFFLSCKKGVDVFVRVNDTKKNREISHKDHV